jgi:hypothetical protein
MAEEVKEDYGILNEYGIKRHQEFWNGNEHTFKDWEDLPCQTCSHLFGQHHPLGAHDYGVGCAMQYYVSTGLEKPKMILISCPCDGKEKSKSLDRLNELEHKESHI